MSIYILTLRPVHVSICLYMKISGGTANRMEYLTISEQAGIWGMSERKLTALCRAGRIPGAEKRGKLWFVPAGTLIPLDARTKEYAERKRTESVLIPSYSETNGYNQVIKAFWDTYQKEASATAFTPYRICPIGAHSDHNLGKVTGFAIDKGIFIAYGPKQNGVVEIRSLQFPKRAQWHVNSTPAVRQNDWADHLRGATIALNSRYPLQTGICAIINGELPIGGLSSSAAVIITFLSALSKMNGIRLSEQELIQISLEAENKYVGVSCGKLDQSCEVYCRKNHLLYLDTRDDTYELIPQSPECGDYEFVIFFSGMERSLASSKFNMRVDEARSAAYELKALAGIEYGKFEDTNLRDVPESVFRQFRTRLPDNFAKRAEHWYTEFRRVEAGAEAWRRGDIAEFGRLSFESGYSSIYNWETGSEELIRLYNIMRETEGIYGGRFSGAGFKGCCVAIIDPAFRDSILEHVREEYLKSFPPLRGRYSAHICHSADGVKL